MALLHEEITHSIIGAFHEVHNALGFGYLEHVYILALEIELKARGHAVAREVSVPVFYKGFPLTHQRFDMVIDGKVLVETKSTPKLPEIAPRQVRSYLQGTMLEVGLLLHFGQSANHFRIICSNQYKKSAKSV
jgi:GxxExxY protein